MKIPTSRFGTLDLDENTFIHFPWGIPGFESLKRYVLLEHRQGPFQWLQAVDDPDVAFLTAPPEVFGITYTITPDATQPIGSPAPDELAVLVMVIVDAEKNTPRAHIAGPILCNAETRTAFQWLIDSREVPSAVTVNNPAM